MGWKYGNDNMPPYVMSSYGVGSLHPTNLCKFHDDFATNITSRVSLNLCFFNFDAYCYTKFMKVCHTVMELMLNFSNLMPA